MNVATSVVRVGIRDLKNGLSQYIDRVRAGEEIIVTDRGHPVARLSPIDQPLERLADLVRSGEVRPPTNPFRTRPQPDIETEGTVSDFVAEQRR